MLRSLNQASLGEMMKKAVYLIIALAVVAKLASYLSTGASAFSENMRCTDEESLRYTNAGFDTKCKRFDGRNLYRGKQSESK
jgi:hypothetical protein